MDVSNAEKNWFQWLRILGMGMLLIGVLLPWFGIGFEPHPTPVQRFGWQDIWYLGSLGVESMQKYGPDLYSTFSLLEGLSGIGLTVYFFYNILAVRGVYKGNKTLSLLIIGISSVFLFNSQSLIIGKIFLGFWLFMFGLLLCAVVEWLSSTNFAAIDQSSPV